MSEFNLPLLRKAVEWVTAQAALPPPDRQWYQGSWRMSWPDAPCDTTYCVAGYICEINGAQWADDSSVVSEPEELAAFNYGEKTVVTASYRARRLLGIEEFEARDLFEAGNDSRRVVEVASRIAHHREMEL